MVPDLNAAKEAKKRIFAKPLFSHVARPVDLKDFRTCGNIRFVISWESAKQEASKKKYWQYAGTVAANSCSAQVYEHLGANWFDSNAERNWNVIGKQILSHVPENVSELKQFCANEAHEHIDQIVFEKVKYDLSCIFMESVYEEALRDTYFRTVIEPFYLAGHFPCGWDTKNKKALKSVKDISTKGELIVF